MCVLGGTNQVFCVILTLLQRSPKRFWYFQQLMAGCMRSLGLTAGAGRNHVCTNKNGKIRSCHTHGKMESVLFAVFPVPCSISCSFLSCWLSPYHLSLACSSWSNLSAASVSQRNSLLHSDWSPGRRSQVMKRRKEGLAEHLKYYLCQHTQMQSWICFPCLEQESTIMAGKTEARGYKGKRRRAYTTSISNGVGSYSILCCFFLSNFLTESKLKMPTLSLFTL